MFLKLQLKAQELKKSPGRIGLRKHHNITISLSTLKRKLKQYKLHRNKVEFDLQVLRNTIVEIIDGPGCSVGYCSVWHALQQRRIRVP